VAVIGGSFGPAPGAAHRVDVRALFEALVDSPDPVFVTDRHDKVVFFNRSAQRVLGFDPEEAVGMRCFAAFEGEDRYGNRYCGDHCPISQIANRGAPVQPFDLRLRAHDGHHVDVQVTVINLTVPEPDLFYLVHAFRVPPASAAPPRHGEEAAAEAEPPAPNVLASRSSADARARRLTAREVEVLGMLAAGRATPEIAERLQISLLTARNHVQNILEKLEVHSKAEAVAFAFQKKIVS
jgi:PAS domain S-box-containing protein